MAKQVLRFDPSSNKADIQLRVERDGEAWIRYRDLAGDPIPQTGNTFQLILRKQAGGAIVIELSTTNGRLTIAGDDDELIVPVFTPETSSIRPDQYFYELIVTRSGKIKNDLTGIAYVTNGSYCDPNG